VANRTVTSNEGADWDLSNFAKQIFEAKNTSEVGFEFVVAEQPPDKASPTSPALEIAVVGQRDGVKSEASENLDPANETASPLAVTEVQEALLPVMRVEAISGEGRQFRTAAEMADIILEALRTIEGVPERGFIVTVYGMNPWNAMLTIKPEAGRIKDPQLWRDRVQEIGARLRLDFDLHER
jgi:hypothetical protein